MDEEVFEFDQSFACLSDNGEVCVLLLERGGDGEIIFRSSVAAILNLIRVIEENAVKEYFSRAERDFDPE
jgi:hypothetical protein